MMQDEEFKINFNSNNNQKRLVQFVHLPFLAEIRPSRNIEALILNYQAYRGVYPEVPVLI